MVVLKIKLYKDNAGALHGIILEGANGVSQNNSNSNKVLVVIDGFELADEEFLRVGYEKQDHSESVAYEAMNDNGGNTYSLDMPPAVFNSTPNSKWELGLQIVSDWIDGKGYAYRQNIVEPIVFTLRNAVKDENNQYPSVGEADRILKNIDNIKNAIGKPNGIATLDESGQLAPSQVPTSVSESISTNAGGIAKNAGGIANIEKQIADIELTLGKIEGLRVSLSMSNGILSVTLIKDDKPLNTATVNLPADQFVTEGSYDAKERDIVLKLKNGDVVRIPVDTLINDLATNEKVAEIAQEKANNALISANQYTERRYKEAKSYTDTSIADASVDIEAEEWTFELEDGTTVTKKVALTEKSGSAIDDGVITASKVREIVEEEISEFDFVKVVDELPTEGLINREYFVRKSSPDVESNDLFDEYAWINRGTEDNPDWGWEFKGTKKFEVDLADYAKKEYVDEEVQKAVSSISQKLGKDWELINEATFDANSNPTDIITFSTDKNGNPFKLKKVKAILLTDTTNGTAYTAANAVIALKWKSTPTTWQRGTYISSLPTSVNKYGKAIFDVEIVDGVAYASVVGSNNLSSHSDAECSTSAMEYGNLGVEITTEWLEEVGVRSYGGNFTEGTKVLIYGMRAESGSVTVGGGTKWYRHTYINYTETKVIIVTTRASAYTSATDILNDYNKGSILSCFDETTGGRAESIQVNGNSVQMIHGESYGAGFSVSDARLESIEEL